MENGHSTGTLGLAVVPIPVGLTVVEPAAELLLLLLANVVEPAAVLLLLLANVVEPATVLLLLLLPPEVVVPTPSSSSSSRYKQPSSLYKAQYDAMALLQTGLDTLMPSHTRHGDETRSMENGHSTGILGLIVGLADGDTGGTKDGDAVVVHFPHVKGHTSRTRTSAGTFGIKVEICVLHENGEFNCPIELQFIPLSEK
jgi:hypothetical protein